MEGNIAAMMDHSLLRGHLALADTFRELFSPRARRLLEFVAVLETILIFGLLVSMHIQYIPSAAHAAPEESCLAPYLRMFELSRNASFDNSSTTTWDILSIDLYDPNPFLVLDPLEFGLQVRNDSRLSSALPDSRIPVQQLEKKQNQPSSTETLNESDLDLIHGRQLADLLAGQADHHTEPMASTASTPSESASIPKVEAPSNQKKDLFGALFENYLPKEFLTAPKSSWNSIASAEETAPESPSTAELGDETDKWTLVGSYYYAKEKGLMMLSAQSRRRFNLVYLNLTLFTNDSTCFGSPFYQGLLSVSWVGHETILLNQLILAFDGIGFVYSALDGGAYNLLHQRDVQDVARGSVEDLVFYKISLLMASLIIAYAVTWFVSLTIRATHLKLFEFAVRFQTSPASPLPVVFSIVINSCLFTAVASGLLALMAELFSSGFTAFGVFCILWVCEFFTLVCARTFATSVLFPRIVFMNMAMYLMYVWSYPFGFHGLAGLLLSSVLECTMLLCFTRFELPAVVAGQVTQNLPRSAPRFRLGIHREAPVAAPPADQVPAPAAQAAAVPAAPPNQ